jgi:hypothetical protein
MRYLLYLLCLAFLAVRQYLWPYSQDDRIGSVVKSLHNYFILTLVIICIELFIRIRKTAYWFFPLGIALATAIFYVISRQHNMATWIPDALINVSYLGLAAVLFYKGHYLKAENKTYAHLLAAVGAVLLLTGIKVFFLLVPQPTFAAADRILGNVWINVLTVIVCAGVLLVKSFAKYRPAEKDVFVFVILMNLIPVVIKIVSLVA